MLIVALQDDIDNLYAIWNTTTDRFLGVNLGNMKLSELLWITRKTTPLKRH